MPPPRKQSPPVTLAVAASGNRSCRGALIRCRRRNSRGTPRRSACIRVELSIPKHWPMLKELGLTCAIAGSHGFAKGFAHKEEWDECSRKLRERIEQCAARGVERVITFSGFRRGLTDEEGIANMVAGSEENRPVRRGKESHALPRDAELARGHADERAPGLLLRLHRAHRGNLQSRSAASAMKVLFDLYHVQIMHGDVIARIKQHKDYIGHIHTAGVPGRGEIDRDAGAQLPAAHAGAARHRLHRLRRPGVYSAWRGQDRVARGGRAHL